jgi:hypothetical protein
MTQQQDKLRRLGQYVLDTLEREENWSAATLDDIADYARCLGLADTDAVGMFAAAPYEPFFDDPDYASPDQA